MKTEEYIITHRQWAFWAHSWTPVAAYTRFQPFMDPLSREIRKDVGDSKTDVLYRCECGRVRSGVISGRWTMEQILAKS